MIPSFIYTAQPLFLQGLWTTFQLWVYALSISLVFGTIIGIARTHMLRIPYLTPMLNATTFIIRGIPFYVQLLITYFIIPDLLGFDIDAMTIGSISLGFCSAAYMSQIIRSGINSIPAGQWEATIVLGHTRLQTIRYIILPQMIRNVLPAMCVELDQILKTTSIFSTIGILELTGVGKNIITREMQPIPVYCAIALLYLMLSSLLQGLGSFVEKRQSTPYFLN